MKQDKLSVATVFQMDSRANDFTWIFIRISYLSAIIIAEMIKCLQTENQIIHNLFYDMVAVLCVFCILTLMVM